MGSTTEFTLQKKIIGELDEKSTEIIQSKKQKENSRKLTKCGKPPKFNEKH